MIDYIFNNLAIGNVEDARSAPSTITALLCVAEEVRFPDLGRLFHKIPIIDMQPIPEAQLKEAVEWINTHRSNHRLLVFCNAGVGRSPSVVVGYLCSILGYGFGEAVEFIARKRPYISTLPDLVTTIDMVKMRFTQ